MQRYGALVLLSVTFAYSDKKEMRGINMAKAVQGIGKATLGERERRRGFFSSVFLTFFLMLMLSATALLGTALSLLQLPDATPYIRTAGCSLGVGFAFLGGLLSGKRQKTAGTLAGLLYGVMFVLTMLICGRFFRTQSPIWWRALGYAILLALSVLGGTLGGMRGAPHHRRRRRVKA